MNEVEHCALTYFKNFFVPILFIVYAYLYYIGKYSLPHKNLKRENINHTFQRKKIKQKVPATIYLCHVCLSCVYIIHNSLNFFQSRFYF